MVIWEKKQKKYVRYSVVTHHSQSAAFCYLYNGVILRYDSAGVCKTSFLGTCD